MFNYKKFSLPMIFTTFFSYSTNKTESSCANSRDSQCLNCFSYLLPAVKTLILRKWEISSKYHVHPERILPAPTDFKVSQVKTFPPSLFT